MVSGQASTDFVMAPQVKTKRQRKYMQEWLTGNRVQIDNWRYNLISSCNVLRKDMRPKIFPFDTQAMMSGHMAVSWESLWWE